MRAEPKLETRRRELSEKHKARRAKWRADAEAKGSQKEISTAWLGLEIGEAVKLVQSTEFDLAILDVNVNGKVITPVAELITARNRPFIFATGYGSSGLPQDYRDRPALQKPFQLETLAQVISATMKNATV